MDAVQRLECHGERTCRQVLFCLSCNSGRSCIGGSCFKLGCSEHFPCPNQSGLGSSHFCPGGLDHVLPTGRTQTFYECSGLQQNRLSKGVSFLPRIGADTQCERIGLAILRDLHRVTEVLKGDYPALGRSQEFDATIAWAEDMLQNGGQTR